MNSNDLVYLRFNFLTGAFEIVGAIGMLIGIWIPVVALWAGLLLGGTMLAAALTPNCISERSF